MIYYSYRVEIGKRGLRRAFSVWPIAFRPVPHVRAVPFGANVGSSAQPALGGRHLR